MWVILVIARVGVQITKNLIRERRARAQRQMPLGYERRKKIFFKAFKYLRTGCFVFNA